MDDKDIQKTTMIDIRDAEEKAAGKDGKKAASLPPKKKKKHKLTKAGRIFFEIVLVAALCAAAYSGWNLYTGLKNYQEGMNEYTQLAEKNTKEEDDDDGLSHVDFDKLREINSDVVGWISLENSVINYPVVYGGDNSYYLTHLFTGEENSTGTVFMDYHNKTDFSDRNTILYAHHMRNGSMFADVEKFKNQEFYDTHKQFRLQTPDGDYYAYPFAGILTDSYADYVQWSFESDEDFMKYVEEKKAQSTFVSDAEVSADDRILTLSTCSYHVENGRYALFLKLEPVK